MQQQQQNPVGPAQPHNNNLQRGPFPWGRMIRISVAVSLVLILSVLTVAVLFVSGHMYDVAFSAPAAIGLILAIIAVLAWLFPFNPFIWRQPPEPTPAPDVSQSQILPLPIILTQTSTMSAPQIATHTVLSSTQIFHVESLPFPDEFYGRTYERVTLINRTSQRSSTSLVGEHRIGTSWLMQYLQQIAPTHAQLGPQVRIGKLSATHSQCQTLTGFVKKALKALNVPVHKPHPHETPLERLAIEVSDMKKQSIIPVLCIDEFAGLIGKPDFGKSFVEGLKAIAEDDGLVLITASREPLHKTIEKITGATSPLFEVMQELTLKPFTEVEAKEFISKKGQQAGLSGDEQAFFLACAAIPQANGQLGWPPLRLQLTGELLLKDKFSGVLALSDPAYQAAFKQHLTEQYQGMVKP